MSFEYVSVEDAIARSGLRMVVVGDTPSAWGEGAKGILHIKGIEWAAVRLVYDDDALKAWARQRSGPVAILDDERPRDRWDQILLLAERMAPTPALLPADPAARALVFGLGHELLGEDGLAWARRIQLIHASLSGQGGFSKRVAHYLGRRYGYTPEVGAAAEARVTSLLDMFSARLRAQKAAGSRYYVGDSVTAVDVYSATCAAMLRPLPPDVCAMNEKTRVAFETPLASPPDELIFAHRDMMYAEHLELPLSL